MSLPTTGPMYMSWMQDQFGGGYPAYLSQFYAGGPRVPPGTTGINGAIPTGGFISLWHFYGAPNSLDTQNLTIGTATGTIFPQGGTYTYTGFQKTVAPVFGSISDGSFNVKGGADIRALYWYSSTGPSAHTEVNFTLNGVHNNDGWTTMTIGTVAYARASAAFGTTETETQWGWVNVSLAGLPGSGTVAVKFT